MSLAIVFPGQGSQSVGMMQGFAGDPAVERHANTSAASVPLALDEAVRDGRIRPGQHVLLEGVGGGFTWGAVLLRW